MAGGVQDGFVDEAVLVKRYAEAGKVKGNELASGDVPRIIALRRAGKSWTEVGDELGRQCTSVKRTLQRYERLMEIKLDGVWGDVGAPRGCVSKNLRLPGMKGRGFSRKRKPLAEETAERLVELKRKNKEDYQRRKRLRRESARV